MPEVWKMQQAPTQSATVAAGGMPVLTYLHDTVNGIAHPVPTMQPGGAAPPGSPAFGQKMTNVPLAHSTIANGGGDTSWTDAQNKAYQDAYNKGDQAGMAAQSAANWADYDHRRASAAMANGTGQPKPPAGKYENAHYNWITKKWSVFDGKNWTDVDEAGLLAGRDDALKKKYADWEWHQQAVNADQSQWEYDENTKTWNYNDGTGWKTGMDANAFNNGLSEKLKGQFTPQYFSDYAQNKDTELAYHKYRQQNEINQKTQDTQNYGRMGQARIKSTSYGLDG